MSESGSVISANDPAQAGTAKLIYILYLFGLLLPPVLPIIVAFAYVNLQVAPAWLQSHYQMQIRTFWIGLLFAVISLVTTMIYIGWLLLLLTYIWWVVRCIKGLIAIFDGASYDNPTGWLW
jgi:uncharacterized membrane protein